MISAAEAKKGTKSKEEVRKQTIDSELKDIESSILRSMEKGDSTLSLVCNRDENVVREIIISLKDAGYKVVWDIGDEDNFLTVEW